MSETLSETAEKNASPDSPAGLPVTVPNAAVDDVLAVWRGLKNEKPPTTPIERFFREVGPTMSGLVAAGWSLKTLYERAKPSIPGVSFTVFRRHAEPLISDLSATPKRAPKSDRRPSKRAENSAAREAVREALDRVQVERETAPPAPARSAAETVVQVVEKPAERAPVVAAPEPDYSGSTIEISFASDAQFPAAKGFRRDGNRWISPPLDGAFYARAADDLARSGASDLRVSVVQPAYENEKDSGPVFGR